MVGFVGNLICRSRSALAKVKICAKVLCTISPKPGCWPGFTAPFILARRQVLSIPVIQDFLLPARISRSGAYSHPGSASLGTRGVMAAHPPESPTDLPTISAARSVLEAALAHHHGVLARP